MSKSVHTPPSPLTNWAHILARGRYYWRSPNKDMPTKLKDTLEKVTKLEKRSNSNLLIEFYVYLGVVRTSERYQSDILKVLVKFSEFINDNLVYVQKKEQVIAFLNTKIKNKEEDPEEKWITTWNDYLNILRLFYRW